MICRAMQGKERKGLEYLYEGYYRQLVIWADTFLRNMGAAEDLVQEFFIKLWEQDMLKGVDPKRLKGYLLMGIRNRALNALEKQDPLRRVGEVAIPIEVWEEYDSWEENIRNRVKQAVEHLPERSREVVKSVYLENMKYREVAEKFGISIATVKTLIVNSLKKLRENVGVGSDILLVLFIKKIHF